MVDPTRLEFIMHSLEDHRDPYAMPLSELSEYIDRSTGLEQAYLTGVYHTRQINDAVLGLEAYEYEQS
jgi:hypothetical protein